MTIEPSSPKDLSNLLAELHEETKLWHPCGLSSRINWGPPIEKRSKPISTRRLNKVINHSAEDLTITVQAGIPYGELQDYLAEQNQWLAIDWPWGTNPHKDTKSSGSIGGLIARGLSGSLRYRHLGVRDQIIGIGFQRSDGIEANAGGKVVKNVAGYDMMRLLCGSWGSLGIITELTLRTQPIKPAHSQIHINGPFPELEEFRCKVIRSTFTPEYFDWVKNDPNEWKLEIGLASVSDEAIKDQIKGLKKLINLQGLELIEEEWEGPLLTHQFPRMHNSDVPWLIRLSIPPANAKDLICSNEIASLKKWNWRFSAGTGIGEGWETRILDIEGISQKNKVDSLRNFIKKINGELIILMQPKNIEIPLKSWEDVPSKSLIEALKYNFDPKSQISIGRLPGVAS